MPWRSWAGVRRKRSGWKIATGAFFMPWLTRKRATFFLRHPRRWTTSGTSTFSIRASIARIATQSLAITSTTRRGSCRKTNAEQMRGWHRFIATMTLMRSRLPRPIRGGLGMMTVVLTGILPAATMAAAPAIMPTDTIPAAILDMAATLAPITVMPEDMAIPVVIPAELIPAEAMVAAGAVEVDVAV